MDLTKFALVVMKYVRDFVQPALDAIDGRIDSLKAEIAQLRAAKPLDATELDAIAAAAAARIPKPADGKDADPEAIMAAARAAVAELPRSANGKDADPVHVAKLVSEEVTKAIAELPAPKNGKDADPAAILEAARIAVAELPKPADGKDADPEVIAAAARAAVDALPKAQDGRSVTIEELAPLVQEAVDKAVALIPAPKDGNSVTPEQVLPDLRAALQEAIAAIPAPADGKSVTVDDLLPVLESMQAKWELDFERRAQDVLQRSIDRMPKPRDGEPGRDGFGFDDMSLEQVDERQAVLRFTRGTAVKEFPIALAGFVDRGVWQEGEYVKGDGCTWDGCYWLAKRDTKQKPCEGDENDWRLAVRKGRKGKDGLPGKDLRNAPVPKLRGRFDTTALDADIELAISGASKIVLAYVGDSVDGWFDSSGDPILDTDGVVVDVPEDIQNATMYLALWFIRNPGGDPNKEWEMGYFPGAAMLYHYRTPTVA